MRVKKSKNNEEHILRLLNNENLLSNISRRTLTKNDLSEFLDFSLAELGNYLKVSRVYLFEHRYETQTMDNTYEWCASDIVPQIDELQGVPSDVMPWWTDTLLKNQVICYSDIEEIPDELVRDILRPQNILSILVVPLIVGGRYWGFIGFDDCLTHRIWLAEDVDILNSISHIISGFIERKRGEDALRESLEQLNTANHNLEERVEQRTREILQLSNFQQAILENAGLAIISTNAEGIIQTFNPAAEKMLGYKADEMIGLATPAIFHDQLELVIKATELKLITGETIKPDFEVFPSIIRHSNSNTSEWCYVRRDKRKIPVILTITSFEGTDGVIGGYIVVAMDISTEKSVIASLRESEERFHKMFHEHEAVMLLVNPITGDIVDANMSAEKFYGYNFSKLESFNISVINCLPLEDVHNEMRKAYNQKSNYFEFSHRLSTGEVRLVEVHSTPIEIDDEKLLFSIIHDITERKTAEQSLIWNEAFLKKMTESTPLAFLVVDNRTDEILYVNHQFCDIWGINHLEDRIRNHELKNNDIIPDCLPVLRDVPAFAESCKPLQDENNRVVVEDEIPFMDGRIIRRFSTQIRADGDKYLGRLYIFEDITKRKMLEQFLVVQRDLTTKLSATSDLYEALSMTLDSVFQIGEIDAGGIYLFNESCTELTLYAHRGLSEKFVKERSFYGPDSPNVKLVLEGKPVYGPYRSSVFPAFSNMKQDEIHSLAVVPFKYEDKVIGVFNLASSTSTQFYGNLQVSIESLAVQIGGTITRIRAENALSASQQNFKLLFDTIDDFMFILDANGNIIKTNSVVEARLGYETEELKNLNVLAVHPAERRDEAGFIVGEMLAGRALFCPVPLQAKNGTQIPVETRVVMGKWDGKDVLYGISRDITERQKAEAALRESEARWNFALEGSGEGVWDWNTQSNEVFYSTQWKAMFGYSNEEIGNGLDEWEKRVHPEDKEQVYSDLQKHISGETEIYRNEHRVLCKDGTYKWILDRGKVVARQKNGQPLRIIGTHSDITNAKLIEEALRSAVSKERELNELKSRFVSMASHEFRTPLASILMMSDSLMAYRTKMDDQQIVSKLQNINDQVQHLAKVVTDVMQVSKIQEGKMEFNPQSVDFIALISKVINDFNANKLLKNKIQLECNCGSLSMKLDSRLLIQVLNNLISNAIKYAQPNPIVKVKLAETNQEVLLSIQDNGIGIPESDQKNLFQPFFRAENVKKIQGNGLGLNIVRESVRLHEGNITFDSNLGKGSTFVVHLPKSLIQIEKQ